MKLFLKENEKTRKYKKKEKRLIIIKIISEFLCDGGDRTEIYYENKKKRKYQVSLMNNSCLIQFENFPFYQK